jgi:hypothetical protein
VDKRAETADLADENNKNSETDLKSAEETSSPIESVAVENRTNEEPKPKETDRTENEAKVISQNNNPNPTEKIENETTKVDGSKIK